MSRIKNLLNLLRVKQYFKNGLLFVGLFFSVSLFNLSLYPLLILGFIVLCCVSSINYIINDIRDVEKDKRHSEKIKKKPLASGEISVIVAIGIIIALTAIAIMIIVLFIHNFLFITMIILLFITGQLYNHLFKNIAFMDIVVLSLGYLWRALAGAVLIEVVVSPWLLLAIFEIAMFLSIAKRKGDLELLGTENAIEHKKIYEKYNIMLLNQFQTIISSSIFITWTLYLIIKFNFFTEASLYFRDYIVFLTVPLLLYIIMRYLYLSTEKPKIARSAEKLFTDKGMVIAGVFLFIILLFAFYYEIIIKLLISIFLQ